MFVYSLYSGVLYQVPDHFFITLDDGQLPLKKEPTLCKKCSYRGYTGFNTFTYTYVVCKCVDRHTDIDKVKNKFNIKPQSVQLQ